MYKFTSIIVLLFLSNLLFGQMASIEESIFDYGDPKDSIHLKVDGVWPECYEIENLKLDYLKDESILLKWDNIEDNNIHFEIDLNFTNSFTKKNENKKYKVNSNWFAIEDYSLKSEMQISIRVICENSQNGIAFSGNWISMSAAPPTPCNALSYNLIPDVKPNGFTVYTLDYSVAGITPLNIYLSCSSESTAEEWIYPTEASGSFNLPCCGNANGWAFNYNYIDQFGAYQTCSENIPAPCTGPTPPPDPSPPSCAGMWEVAFNTSSSSNSSDCVLAWNVQRNDTNNTGHSGIAPPITISYSYNGQDYSQNAFPNLTGSASGALIVPPSTSVTLSADLSYIDSNGYYQKITCDTTIVVNCYGGPTPIPPSLPGQVCNSISFNSNGCLLSWSTPSGKTSSVSITNSATGVVVGGLGSNGFYQMDSNVNYVVDYIVSYVDPLYGPLSISCSKSFICTGCQYVDPDDGCALTLDSFDMVTCLVINQAPDCDDGCTLTMDSFNAIDCECIHSIPNIEDGCSLTLDSFDLAECVILHLIPDCNDNDCETSDYFDLENCMCINDTSKICDDFCELTNDYYDNNACICVFEDPNIDDGCPMTLDSFDLAECLILNIIPDCNDNNCETSDYFDAVNCRCVNDFNLVCDDGCSLTTDSYDQANCKCVFEIPNLDDGCELTLDSFDVVNCLILNIPLCNDGCPLTEDGFDENNCLCFYIDPNVDDGCAFTIDSFNIDSCVIYNIPLPCNDLDSCTINDKYIDCICVGDIVPDQDSDNLCDSIDNCIKVYNPDQSDFDGDGIGDVCDGNISYDKFCLLFSLIKGSWVSQDRYISGFWSEDENYLKDTIPQMDIDLEVINNLKDTIQTLTLNFRHYSDGVVQISYAELFDLNNDITIASLKEWYSVEKQTTSEVDSVQIEVEILDKEGSTFLCQKYTILKKEEVEEDMSLIECGGELYQNYTNVELIEELKQGDVLSIRGFPLMITTIANQGGGTYSGRAVMAIPFKSKTVIVDLIKIKVNTDKEIIEGSVEAWSGTLINQLPELDIPVIDLNGIMCVPPSEPSGYGDDGFDPVTGLNPYGFDKNGEHYLTGGPYDPNGFDTNGINEQTGGPSDENGCNRDGFNMETNEPCLVDNEKEKKKLFIDSLLNNNIIETEGDSLIQLLIQEMNSKKAQKEGECNSIRTVLETGAEGEEDHFFGSGNVLLNEGLSRVFKSTPLKLKSNYREPERMLFEENHISLFYCDDTLQYYKAYIQALNNIDIELFKDFIISEVDDLNAAELDLISNDHDAFISWLFVGLTSFITDTFQLPDLANVVRKNQELWDANETSSYYDVASVNQQFSTYSAQPLEALKFEYLQGFDKVMGIPRPIITEALFKAKNSLNSSSIGSQLLPISIENSIGGYNYKILIDRIIVDASNGNAFLDAAIVISDPHSSNKIAFAAENIGINNTGLADATSRLFLVGDAELKINNASRLIFHGDQDLTFIEWDCDGVTGGGIDATVDFCTEHLLPIDPNTNKAKTDGSSYSFRVTKVFDKWLNFVLVIQDAQPFALTTLPGYVWNVDNIGLDLHDEKGVEDAGIGDYSVPPGYNSLLYDEDSNTFDPRWRGFVLEELSVTFPNTFNKGNSNLTAVGIENLVIDNNGASGVAFIEGEILSYSAGNLDGWQFSVEDLSLLVLQNHLAGGGFGGKIGVPVLKDPLKYKAVIAGKDAFNFKIEPTKEVKVPMFIAEATIEKCSYIKASYDGNGFTALASLTGDLKFVSFDTTILKTMSLPQLRFEGLKVSNKDPYLEPGNWGITGDISGSSMSWNGFGISVDSIHMFEATGVDSIRLGIDLGVAMIDSMLIAKGGFEVKGVFTVNNEGIQKWNYDGIRLRHFCIDGTIKEFMRVRGCVEFYDEHTTGNNGFGKGFRGGLDVKLKALGDRSIWAVGQFGKVDSKKYFFIDLGMETKEINLGPFNLNAIGGGVAKGMELTGVVNYGEFLDPFNITNEPLGTTLSGLHYSPVPEDLFKVRLFTRFTLANNDKLLNGVGEFIIGFEQGVLDNFEFIATANFMSDVNYEVLDSVEIPKQMQDLVGEDDSIEIPFDGMNRPNTGSAMNGYCRLKLSFQEPAFTGNFAVWLTAGIVQGAGANNELVWAEMKFNKDEWYLWMGTPQSPAGLKMELPGDIVNVTATGYFDIGTSIPDFPGLPAKLRHLGRNLNINTGIRNSGLGVVVGASIDASIGLDLKIISGNVSAFAGFDLMIRKYDGVSCMGREGEIGINGWYAMGQAWIGAEAELSVGPFKAASAGATALIQARLPNPTWLGGALEFKYSVFGFGGSAVVDFEMGEFCQFEFEAPGDVLGFNYIGAIMPVDSMSNIEPDIIPFISFNQPLERELILDNGNGLESFVAKINQDSTGIYHNDYKIESEFISHKNWLKMRPEDFLYPNDSFDIFVKVDIFKDEVYFDSHRKRVTFYTGNTLEMIPNSNISYSYPIDGMLNFYKKEYAQEIGFIGLKSGQPELLYPDGFENLYVRFCDNNESCFETPGIYDNLNRRLEFAMPSAEFANATPYRLDVIIKNEEFESENNTAGNGFKASSKLKDKSKVLATLYFRTSVYDFLEDKLVAIDQQRLNPKDLARSKYVYTNFENFENFDATEIDHLISFNSQGSVGGTLLNMLDYGLTVSDNGFAIKPYPFETISGDDQYVYAFGTPESYMTEGNFTTEEFKFSDRIANGTKLYSVLYEAYEWLEPQMEALEIYMLTKGVNILSDLELKSFLGNDFSNYKGLRAPREPDPRIDIQYVLPGGIETFNSLHTGVSLYNEYTNDANVFDEKF